MHPSLLQKVNIGFASALAVLVAIALIASWSAERLHEETRRVQLTHDAIRGVGDILHAVLDAESAQRAFVLTSAQPDLQAHALAVASLPKSLKRVRLLINENSRQRERLTALQTLVDSRFSMLDDAIALHQADPGAHARQNAFAIEGAPMTVKIRKLAAELLDEEEDLLQRREAVCEARAHKTVGVIAALGLLAVVLVTIASVVVQRDYAARARAEAQAHRAFALLDETRDGLFIFNLEDLRFTYVNHGAVEQTGYSREELLQLTPLTIEPEFNEDSFIEKVTPVVRGTEQALTFTTRHRRKDGTELPVEIILQCITLPNGPRAFVALVRDITERAKAEAEIRKLNTELEDRVVELAMKIATYTRRD